MVKYRFLSVILIIILIDASIQSYANPEKRSAPTNLEQGSAPTNLEQGSAPTNLEKRSAPTNLEKRSAPTNLEQGSVGLRWRREAAKTNSNKNTGKGNKKKNKGNKSKKVGKGKKKSVKGKKKNGKGKNLKGKKGKGKGKKNKGKGKKKSVKGKKKNKKGKGKKKNKKGKGKKKNKKGKKKNKKGKKKNKKGKKQNKKNKTLRQTADAFVLSCSVDILDVFKTYTSKQRSIKRQISRTATKISLITNKKNKKDIFITSFNNTMLGTGGDPKNPKCKAEGTLTPEVYSVLIEDLKNISQVLETCPADVDSNCLDPTTPATTTQVDLCKKYVDDFEKDLTACTKLTTAAEVCTCFTTMTTAAYYAGMKADCADILKISDDAKTSSATCVSQFGICKKAEDSAVRRVAECGVVGVTKTFMGNLTKIADIVFDDEDGDDDDDDAGDVADIGDGAIFFM